MNVFLDNAVYDVALTSSTSTTSYMPQNVTFCLVRSKLYQSKSKQRLEIYQSKSKQF